MVFGVSAGGLAALETARTRPDIRKVAVYEPALVTNAGWSSDWISRFDQEMAQGNTAAALITSMYGFDLAPPVFKLMPRRLLESLTRRSGHSRCRAVITARHNHWLRLSREIRRHGWSVIR